MSVRFTETMSGFYAPDAPAYDTGDLIGRRDGIRLRFRLTMAADSVRQLIADPLHRMRAEGTILCKEFSAVDARVDKGEFQVFAPAGRGRFTMRYRLPFGTAAGPMTLLGYKDVGDDWGPDMWSDTTTLNTRLMHGDLADWVDDGAVDGEYARGILTLTAPMFARQLSTFRGTPTGIGLFGLFFGINLLAAYTGPADRRRLR